MEPEGGCDENSEADGRMFCCIENPGSALELVFWSGLAEKNNQELHMTQNKSKKE